MRESTRRRDHAREMLPLTSHPATCWWWKDSRGLILGTEAESREARNPPAESKPDPGGCATAEENDAKSSPTRSPS